MAPQNAARSRDQENTEQPSSEEYHITFAASYYLPVEMPALAAPCPVQACPLPTIVRSYAALVDRTIGKHRANRP
jgi:hypothetical protein